MKPEWFEASSTRSRGRLNTICLHYTGESRPVAVGGRARLRCLRSRHRVNLGKRIANRLPGMLPAGRKKGEGVMTDNPVYGQQENSACNGHFESTRYHPLLLFSREGDCLAAKLRPGNLHSAEDWEALLLPEGPEGTPRQQKLGKEVVFRARPRGYPCLRQAGDLRGAGEARREVRHPHSVQRQFGAGHQRVADAAQLPSVPVQRGTAVVEPHRVQPGEPLAAGALWARCCRGRSRTGR